MGNNKNIKKAKTDLINTIDNISNNISKYVNNPNSDFKRNRKISFNDIIKTLFSMEGGSMKIELLKAFNHNISRITDSGFNQQRSKIKTSAFETIFKEYTKTIKCNKRYKGYRLLACDGSVFSIAHNPNDPLTYIQPIEGCKGYNALHLNALYDILNHSYLDVIIQNIREQNEKKAYNIMVDRLYHDDKTIIIADRGYSTFNNFAHAIENNYKFVTRSKDINSNGSLSLLNLPDTEFDIDITYTLCSSDAKKIKNNVINYKFIRKRCFDYKINGDVFYPISLRIIRFKLPSGGYECITTNLSRNEFSIDDIKELYHLRWGIETSFRELKYNIGAINFHSKKKEFIIQELFIKLTLFNYCQIIMQQIVIKKKQTKLEYAINSSIAFYLCKQYLKNVITTAKKLSTLISKELQPIRRDRHDNRKIQRKGCVSFTYRVAA